MTEPRIQLHDVVKRFDETVAVERLDLVINRGEFVVLLGPSGCGKTTTLRMIAGLETPTEGRIVINNRDVTQMRPGLRDIAFVFQLFALYPHLTAEENIAFPLRAAGLGRDEVKRRVEAVIDRLDLQHLRKRKPRHLSGGDQQRVSLARAMVRDPAAFLMDEPLGTLDADQRERTRQRLRAIHNELGATTVFVTHDQLEAMGLADRIAVMNEGKLLQYDSPRRVYEYPANLFVAHFIGSPGMNFLDVSRQNGSYRVERSELSLRVDANGHEKPLEKLTLGIRPEHVLIDADGAPAVAEHTELLGSYNMVALSLGGKTLKARVSPQQRFPEGEQVRVRFDPGGCRWFDPGSGNALPWIVREVKRAAL